MPGTGIRFSLFPITVIGCKHPIVVCIAAIYIGAFENRRFHAGLYQLINHFADQRLGNGNANGIGGGTNAGIQPLDRKCRIALLRPGVDGHIRDLIHFLSGAMPGGTA